MPRPPLKRKQKRSVNKKPAFLAAFRACGSLTEAALRVGIDRHAHYNWLDPEHRQYDAAYVAAFERAKPEAAQNLVDSAVDQAMVGDFIPNVYQGRFCYPQEQYDITPAIPAVPAGDWKDEPRREAVPEVPAVMGWRDVPGSKPLGVYRRSEMLKLALLRAWVPEFKRQAEVTGKDGGPVESTLVVEFVRAKPKE